MNPWLILGPAAVAGAAGLTAYGAVNARAQVFGRATFQTGSARKLAITFDDGPNRAVTPKLLDLLARYNARATFFVLGKFVRECPDLLKEIAARGHEIGNHTETHPNLFFCGPDETRDELKRCSEAIASVTLAEPRWFRPPFGFRSPWTGEIVQHMGLRMATWTLLPGDWRGKPAEWLIERLKPITEHAKGNLTTKDAKPAAGGDVLCLHDGDFRKMNGDRLATVQALEYWLPRWRDIGLEFVTMTAGADDSAK